MCTNSVHYYTHTVIISNKLHNSTTTHFCLLLLLPDIQGLAVLNSLKHVRIPFY